MPDDEINSEDAKYIFIVMEHAETDLKALI